VVAATVITWLPELLTETPQEGYDLAEKLARVVIRMTQADTDVRKDLRTVYERDAQALIAISAVVATHFQTIAPAKKLLEREMTSTLPDWSEGQWFSTPKPSANRHRTCPARSGLPSILTGS
jgi:hypothetical protein